MGLETLAAALIWGCTGFVLGLTVPDVSKKLLVWKSRRKNREYTVGDTPIFTRLLYGLLAGILFGMPAATQGGFITAELSLLSLLCLVIAFIDNRVRIIANETLLILLPLAVALRATCGGWQSIAGGFGAAGITLLLLLAAFVIARKKDGIGAGDVKFLVTASFTAGFPGVFVMLAAMGVVMLIVLLGGAFLKKIGMHSYFPMGGYIAAGLLASFFTDELTVLMNYLTGGA